MTYIPKLVLSPMAGLTDAPFRQLCLDYGADYTVSEMITSKTQLWDSDKTQQRVKGLLKTKPSIIQIAGSNIDDMVGAAKMCQNLGVDAIEINMGCPAKKVCSVLSGSALLKDTILVKDIIQAVVDSVTIPVYLKTRLGWDRESINIYEVGEIAQNNGIDRLIIHGRTRCDFFNGKATYDEIIKVNDMLDIDVYANGDIIDIKPINYILSKTNIAGFYIGRGALGCPWIFQQLKQKLSNNDSTPIVDIKQVIIKHISSLHEHYGEFVGVKFARKNIKYYNDANNLNIKLAEFMQLDNASEQLNFIDKLEI